MCVAFIKALEQVWSVAPLLFVVFVNYLNAEIVDRTRPQHLDWIQRYAADGTMLLTGRQASHKGGVLVAQADSDERIREILAQDPYVQSSAAEHIVTAFDARNGSLLSSLRS
jgi:uncharacterized protein YciI